jgi:hypothetical protein
MGSSVYEAGRVMILLGLLCVGAPNLPPLLLPKEGSGEGDGLADSECFFGCKRSLAEEVSEVDASATVPKSLALKYENADTPPPPPLAPLLLLWL